MEKRKISDAQFKKLWRLWQEGVDDYMLAGRGVRFPIMYQIRDLMRLIKKVKLKRRKK